MSLKACLRGQLEKARGFTERMLADFHTPEQWTHQVHEQANHALWFVGHMAFADNFFISALAPERALKLTSIEDRFGMGSHPVANAAEYPNVDEVLALMRERRQVLLSILDGMSEADLEQPMPKELTDLFQNRAGVLEMAVWHEGLHSGQVSVARRSLGHSPFA